MLKLVMGICLGAPIAPLISMIDPAPGMRIYPTK